MFLKAWFSGNTRQKWLTANIFPTTHDMLNQYSSGVCVCVLGKPQQISEMYDYDLYNSCSLTKIPDFWFLLQNNAHRVVNVSPVIHRLGHTCGKSRFFMAWRFCIIIREEKLTKSWQSCEHAEMAHFTNGSSITIHIRWKFRYDITRNWTAWSQQNFAHHMIVVLS